MNEKIEKVMNLCLVSSSKDPIRLFLQITKQDYINMHGPEHHFLDGACILTAYYNVTKAIDLKSALEMLASEAIKMPGGMCGKWGVCGAVSSIGASLAIIDGTGPLSSDGSWGAHMAFTSKAIETMGKINGPRCCKRDGVLSLEIAIDYLKETKNITLEKTTYTCPYSHKNKQCLFNHCPYFCIKE